MACMNLKGSLLLPLPSKTLAFNSTTAKIGHLSFRSSYVRVSRSVRASAFSFSSSKSNEDLRPAIDENPEGIISGEWPENFSLLSYDDLRVYLENQIISEKTKPTALLKEVVKSKGANPFGEARPREEVLKEKGKDWKEIDEKLEAVKIQEVAASAGRKGFGVGNGLKEDRTERAWRKPGANDATPASPTPPLPPREDSVEEHLPEN